MIVKAKIGKTGQDTSVEYEFGKDLEESVGIFGEAVVHAKFIAAAKVDLQSALRRCIESGTDPSTFVENWIPGTRGPSVAKDPMAMALAGISKMSDEQKMALIEKLRAG